MVPAASMQNVAASLPETPATVLLTTLPPCSVNDDPLGHPPPWRGDGLKVTVVVPPAAQWIVDGVKNGAVTVPEPPVGPLHPDNVNVPPESFTPEMPLQVTGADSAVPDGADEHPVASAPAANAHNNSLRRMRAPRPVDGHRPTWRA